MSQTTTRDERQSALDEFASIKMSEPGTALTTVSAGPPADYIHGAQLVQNPRDEMKVLQRIKVLAAAAGEGWYYRFPVRDNKTGRTSWIEGPSIKLANAVALIYGNCEVDCRAQDLGSAIMFHARFFDVESGFALTRPFQQRKGVSKLGGADEGRRDDASFQIGVSKASRNAVVNALQTYCDYAFEEAKDSIVDKIGKDIEKWRGKIVERFGARVDLRRVEAVIGRTADKWLAPDIARIIAMGKSVEDGMATMDETFPPLDNPVEEVLAQQGRQAALDGKLDAFADEKSMVNTDAAGDQSATSDQTAAGERTTPAAVDRLAIINKLLGLASEDGPVDERLERLDVTMHDLIDQLPALEAFTKDAAQTAAKVAKGEVKEQGARKYLEGLAK